MNGVMLQSFHWYTPCGYLWKAIHEQSSALKALGISAVWLPPAYKCASGELSVGYDPYDLFDLGEFDQKGAIATRYGTKAEYLNAVKKLQEYDIQVLVDVVLNHKAGGDEKEEVWAVPINPEQRNEALGEAQLIEAYTRFTFPGRGRQYSDFIWDSNCFSGVDYDEKTKRQQIFALQHNYDTAWETLMDAEKGNFDYLMHCDLEFRNAALRDELDYWARWYYDTVQFDGLRLDALKHMAPEFVNLWLDKLQEYVQKPLFVVGEYWAPENAQRLLEYLKATEGRMQLFDVALQHRFHTASVQGADYDLSRILQDTLLLAAPLKAVTFVENHDTQAGQALAAPVQNWFKPLAYALILLRAEGYPCVFSPDLLGSDAVGEQEFPKIEAVEKLLKLRQHFNKAQQIDYFDHPNCIAWIREAPELNSLGVVICSNGAEGFKDIQLDASYGKAVFIDFMQQRSETLVLNDTAMARFYCNAGGLSVWILKEMKID